MKKIIVIFFVLIASLGFSQTDTTVQLFADPETPPEYPGGNSEMMRFIMKNLNYPAQAREAGISGKTYIKFVVNEDGTISNIESVKKNINCPACDAEVIRVIKLMPKWKPGEINNKPIKSCVNLPMNICGIR